MGGARYRCRAGRYGSAYGKKTWFEYGGTTKLKFNKGLSHENCNGWCEAGYSCHVGSTSARQYEYVFFITITRAQVDAVIDVLMARIRIEVRVLACNVQTTVKMIPHLYNAVELVASVAMLKEQEYNYSLLWGPKLVFITLQTLHLQIDLVEGENHSDVDDSTKCPRHLRRT